MRYVAAYLLAVFGGKREPAVADIEKILGSVGIECDKTKATLAISQLKGKNVEQLIEQGKEKLSSVPAGGGAAAAAAPAAAAPAAAAAAGKKEAPKKEEKKKEESDEEGGEEGIFGLFD